MRISLLLEREPFGEILERTLPTLLTALSGQRHVVKWHDNARVAASHPDGQREQLWICNPYLNAIFRPTVHADAFMPVLREFARSTAWWRRPAQYAYAAAATRRPTAGWLAGPRVTVSPPVKEADALIIMGGNNRLRIADAASGAMHVILKVGRDPHRVSDDLALRRAAPYLPIPSLLQVGEGEAWFTEALAPGRPLNRLPERRDRDRALRHTRAALEQLVRRTMREVPREDYIDCLLDGIVRGLTSTPLLAKCRDRLGRIARTLARVGGEPSHAQPVTVAQTHGDLQPGNVLAGDGRVWIIDWEYTAPRQSGFDALTYSLRSRFPSGLATRALTAVTDGHPVEADLLHHWPGLTWETHAARCRTLAIFLLEELLLRIRESEDTAFRCLSTGTELFFTEVERASGDLVSLAA